MPKRMASASRENLSQSSFSQLQADVRGYLARWSEEPASLKYVWRQEAGKGCQHGPNQWHGVSFVGLYVYAQRVS